MPSVEHERIVAAPFSEVWPFVRDMDNWAPRVTGYQRHEKLSDTESIWYLKGELGGLTRVAEFKALVTEWDESGRVSFTLEGVNEPVVGNGNFIARELTAGQPALSRQPQTRGLSRLLAWMARHALGLLTGKRSSSSVSPQSGAVGETQLTFRLTIQATGMAGGVLNLLITPMLQPVAEDLANGIADSIVPATGA
ncbi:CoxG family protein [Rhizorhabdus dicambivorans]|uniref:SRPBCC family protein n=1 Tax=Rhizorhabdus dicambivorans TaxID=1850238 RepID=A0A2A4FNY6_9SPHN|nr:SRPBCC family protein [Rhizorhabdus dicambivorans]ATE65474.1 SRPBCC family protein [Rhizorhabdus dicambivorans]PCE39867.1 SRPBCC family protein [Rhizorhabdus dicambivorans]